MAATLTRGFRSVAFVLTAALMLLWLPMVAMAAAPPYVDPVQVSIDLRACDDPNLANCVADSAFANGNLGKAFAELDRVAFRAYLTNGSPNAQTFHLRLAADHELNGFEGYDLQSNPVAAGACTSATLVRNDISPIGASADASISTVVEVAMASGASCTLSFTQRLAIGSKKFPGSNLQARVLNGDFSSIGGQTISIPVRVIHPQEIAKTASTNQTQGYAYTVGKTAGQAGLTINSCLAPASAANVTYTVSWTRTAQAAQASTVTGTITLKNPSTRALSGTVTDQLMAGGNPVAGASATFANQVVAAGGTLAIPYSITVPVGTVGALTNSASVVYDDPDVPGTPLAALGTSVSVPAATGTTTDGPSASATITDTESFTAGTGLEFRRLTPTPAMAGYATSDTFTQTVSSGTSGTISVSKIVRATGPANSTGTLRNRVTITPGGGSASAPVDVDIPVTVTAANPTITVSKSLVTGPAAATTFDFTITNNDTNVQTPVSVTVPAGATSASSAATTVAPSATGYTVTEATEPGYLPAAPSIVGALALCGSGSASFTNVASTTALGITKSSVPPSGTTVEPGDTITYTLGYFNTGNTAVVGAVVSDPLPAGVTFVSASDGGTEAGGVVSWPPTTVGANTTPAAPAGTRTVTVRVNSPLADGTVLSNFAWVNTTRSNTVTHTVSSAPVLGIVKSSVPASGTTVAPADTITYTLAYSNTGNDAATGAVISDTLPTEVTFVSASHGGTLTNGVVTWPAVAIPAGGSGTRTITVTVNSPLTNGTVITNTGWINAVQSNAVTHPVRSAPVLGLVKSATPASGTTVAPGATIVYTLTYANTGTDASAGAVITDPLPANTTFVSASDGGTIAAGVVTFPAVDVAAGASGTRTITVTVNSPLANGTAIPNFARINAISSNTVTHTVASAPVLGLVKSAVPAAGTPVNPGDTISYTLSYANTGTDAATGAVITDPVPANTSFVSASDGGTVVAGVVTFPAFDIAVGATGSRTITVTVSSPLPNGTVIANFGRINAIQSNTVQHPVSSAPVLGLVKSASPASGTTVPPGATVVYTLAYSNTGNDAATGAVITDPLPASVNFVSASDGGAFVAGVVTFPPVDIPVGGSGTRTITVAVKSPLANGTAIANFGRINAVQSNTVQHTVLNPFIPPPPDLSPHPSPDPSPSTTDSPSPSPTPSASRSPSATPAPAAALTLIKASDPIDGNLVSRNALITYTLLYVNTGTGPASGAVITDAIPAGTTFESVADGGTYDAASSSVRWVLDIAPGAGGTVSFTVRVRGDAPSAALIRNVAAIDGVRSNPVQHRVTVRGALALSKAVDKDSAAIGETVTYQVTVSASTGGDDQRDVVVSDVVPDGSTYVPGSAGCPAPCLAAYDATTRTVTWAVGTLPAGTSRELTFGVTIDPTTEARTVRNTAIAQAGAGPRTPSNEVQTVVTVVLGVVFERPQPRPTLPVTGAPAGTLFALGLALVAGGAALTAAPRLR